MITCPYTSQENGIIKRKHTYVIKLDFTLLAQGSVPFKFWIDFFTTVVYLINWLPTPMLNNQIPFEKLLHKPHSYNLF